MTTLTHTVECGPLGEVDLTISYKFRKGFAGTRLDPSEPDSATIYWVKLGSQEVDLSDDYISDVVIPACIEDWNGAEEVAIEARGDMIREEQRMAA